MPFGLTFDSPHVKNYWGARAILKNHKIDLLNDRQTFEGPDNDAFGRWLNERALPWLKETVDRIGLQTDDPQTLDLWEYKYQLQASTKRSYGYLYIGAVEHVVCDGNTPQIVKINDKDFYRCEQGTPIEVGTTGRITVNGIGKATVRGFRNVNLDPIYRVYIMAECHEQPKWLKDQTKNREHEQACKKNQFLNKREEIKWLKDWTMPLLPIDFLSFKPD